MMKKLSQTDLANVNGGTPDWLNGVLCGVGLATATSGVSIVLAIIGCGAGLYDALG